MQHITIYCASTCSSSSIIQNCIVISMEDIIKAWEKSLSGGSMVAKLKLKGISNARFLNIFDIVRKTLLNCL